jgi:hypothetical protein
MRVGVNSRIKRRQTVAGAVSLCLEKGAPYEIECAASSSDRRAEAAAAVQDSARAALQLRPPVPVELLAERRPPRLARLVLPDLPALIVEGEDVEKNLGLRFDDHPSLLERGEALRRAVRAIRDSGWVHAIVMPGFAPDIHLVLLPRSVMESNVLTVDATLRFSDPLPRPLAEYVAGVRRDFPDAPLTGIELPGIRTPTISWRPPLKVAPST